MVIYPKRNPDILNCTDLVVGDIVMYAEDHCLGQEGSCQWTGYFRVEPYNQGDATLTYLWDVDVGVIDPTDEEYVTVQVTAAVDTIINVSCTITDPDPDPDRVDVMVKEFNTNHSGR